jgi:hypothetical protein
VEESFFKRQIIPISLTAIVCGFLVFLLWIEVLILNHFTAEDIVLTIRWTDVLVGLTIYLKTAIDFAIFIGRLIDKYPGWKNRVAIEIGTAFGNALGTLLILILWTFFRQIEWLLAIMIFVAALVLLKLAEDSFEHADKEDGKFPKWFSWMVSGSRRGLIYVNHWLSPVMRFVVPELKIREMKRIGFVSLLFFSFTVPFILGLDDFAGYVPLFNVVNVFGFSIGVFLGHMILNIFLYLNPQFTIKAVKNPVISFLGAIVFIGLAIWGFYEALHLLF